MSVVARALARSRRLMRRFASASLTLRRPHDLAGAASRALERLLLRRSASEGSLRLELGGAGPLTGGLPAGLGLTLDGQRYRLFEDAEPGPDAEALPVSLTAPLLAEVMAGATAELDSAVELHFPQVVRRSVREDRLPAELVGRVRCEVVVARAGTDSLLTPRVGDLAEVRGPGAEVVTGEVLAVPASTAGEWVLRIGA